MPELEEPRTPALFTADELALWMGQQVYVNRAAELDRHATARLLEWSKLEELPGSSDPGFESFRSWAVELGALWYDNPTGLVDDRSADTFSRWHPRAREIKAEVEAWAANRASSAGRGRPQGSFPTAQPYPDPLVL